MVGLTHSTCGRNVASCLEDATQKLDATIDRVVGWQMDWREILSVQSDEAGAKLECKSDGIVVLVVLGEVGSDEAVETMTLPRFWKGLRGRASFYGKARGDASDRICTAVPVVVVLHWCKEDVQDVWTMLFEGGNYMGWQAGGNRATVRRQAKPHVTPGLWLHGSLAKRNTCIML